MAIYSIFNKPKVSRPSNCDDSSDRKRLKSDNINVVSYDIPSEVSSIRKLMKDYFAKHNFPKEYCEFVGTFPVIVKTKEREEDASLTVHFNCPLCSGKSVAGGYRELKATWQLSNLNRHFQSHKKNEDKLPGTVSSKFFQSTLVKSSENTVVVNVGPRRESNDDPDDDLFELDNTAEDNGDSSEKSGQVDRSKEPSNGHINTNQVTPPASSESNASHEPF